MISKLTLKNFRCFQDFTLDGICPVTLIAGVNNVGKSTILESIYLFENRYTENVYLTINSLRGLQQMNLSPQMVWEPLFSNMDTSKDIEISVMDAENSTPQTLSLSRDDSFSMTSLPKQFSLFRPTLNSYPLKTTYENQSENDIAHLVLTDKEIIIIPEKSINTKVPSIRYLCSKIAISPVKSAEMLSSLLLGGEQARVIKVMKLLEPRIKDLSVAIIAGEPIIYADLGISRLPINVLGDGINKLMQLIFTMLTYRNSIVLIDEIENGFHYTFFPKLWEVIGELSTLTDCQVFATTHSYECICGALDISKQADLFRFVRLDKEDGGVIVAKTFDDDSFSYAINHEWEVR